MEIENKFSLDEMDDDDDIEGEEEEEFVSEEELREYKQFMSEYRKS